MKFQVTYDVIDLEKMEAFEEDVLDRVTEVVEAEDTDAALKLVRAKHVEDGIGVYFFECNWIE